MLQQQQQQKMQSTPVNNLLKLPQECFHSDIRFFWNDASKDNDIWDDEIMCLILT